MAGALPTDVNSTKHEKKVTMFTGVYGDRNPEYYCLFAEAMADVFERKPCTNGPSRFGVYTLCLSGKAAHDFRTARAAIDGPENNVNFASTKEEFARTYFLSNTPRYDQIEYLKQVR
ncbi:hypothetical protein ACA910_008672 [Epithemia clementina (nom. ined.)]